jgi:hypothetical protein
MIAEDIDSYPSPMTQPFAASKVLNEEADSLKSSARKSGLKSRWSSFSSTKSETKPPKPKFTKRLTSLFQRQEVKV